VADDENQRLVAVLVLRLVDVVGQPERKVKAGRFRIGTDMIHSPHRLPLLLLLLCRFARIRFHQGVQVVEHNGTKFKTRLQMLLLPVDILAPAADHRFVLPVRDGE
jgi:hypothetical protein